MAPNEEIEQVLEAIGLNKNEILVYLDLLRQGKSSATDISNRTKIHRSNTYDVLDKLAEKGIVQQTIENEKKFFYPIDPKDLLNIIKQQETAVKRIIPKLEDIQNIPREEIKVTVSEGLTSIKNASIKQLECGKEILSYGASSKDVDVLGGYIKDFHNQRIQKGIKLRRIYGIDELTRVRDLNTLALTEARYLSLHKSKVSWHVCGKKVTIFHWEPPFSAVVIESQPIAETFKHNFELMWEESKEPSH